MKIKSYFLILTLFFSANLHSFMVHIIGDSHAFFCFNNTQSGITANEISTFYYSKNDLNITIPFYIHWLGSRTMHRVGRDGIQGLNIRQLGVQENDIAVFLFGEVDVRCHIGRQRDQEKRDSNEVIETLVRNYLQVIADNKKTYNNIFCVVVSVTPPCDRGFNPAYPFYGPLQERVTITKELNKFLQYYGQKTDISFLDIYSMYAEPDGSLGVSLSDGIIHINPKYNTPIKEKLVELLINNNMFYIN